MVGLLFAIEHPNRVDRLVLSNTTPGFVLEEAGDFALPVTAGAYTEAMAAAEQGLPEGVRRMSELMYSPAAVEQAPSIVDDAVECCFGPVFAQSPEARTANWTAYGAFNVRDRLSEIQSPTLVMTSSSDRIGSPAQAWTMWNEIPRSTLIALDGIGHDWMAEAPVLGSRLVTMFINGEMDPTYK
jgi:pimeloyl-ACP methyl ester carboxylesterase